MTTAVPIVTCLPILYQQCTNRQKQSKDSQTADKWPLVYQSSQVYQDCTNSVPTVKNSQKTVKTAEKWPLVYQSSQVYQDWTNNVTMVYQSSKTVKNSKTAKMTFGVPIVTCLHRVRRIHEVRVRRIHKAVCAYHQCCHLVCEVLLLDMLWA